ncbi:MAG: hypothetical protein ACP5G2_02365 [Candidatus Bipolaricaulaceae bacterium]
MTEGAITLDSHDIRELTLASLRRQISLVLQDVFLFHGTVRENILFGRPSASEAEMVEAARIANAHEFIAELPDGYDTLIGERGGEAVRRPAAAAGHRPGGAQGRADPHPGRGNLCGGPPD